MGRHRRLGTTIDDAAGEAFDKAAKMLGLGYPGGPALERAAAAGDPKRIPLPRPMLGRPGADFSFSGLKTALRHRLAEATERVAAGGDVTADLAASFQAAVIDCLADRTAHGIEMAKALAPVTALVVAGGVAANTRLRARLAEVAAAGGLPLVAPPVKYCTDNAAMIAWAGNRAAAPRPHRRPRFRAAAALAPGSDGEARGPRLSDDEALAPREYFASPETPLGSALSQEGSQHALRHLLSR